MKRNHLLLSLALFLITSCIVPFISSCKKAAAVTCKITRIYTTDSFDRTDVVYDGDRVIREDYRLKTGASEGSTVYQYSSTNKLSSIEDLDSTGIVLRKTEYIFDSQDRVITENYYVKSGATLPLNSYYTYEYYSNGNLQKLTRYTSSSAVLRTTYYTDYDANGNSTRGYYNNNLGVTTDSFFYTYDTHPNYQSFFNYRMGLNKNNQTSYTSKPLIGSVFMDTYIYNYNAEGLVTYELEAFDGEKTYVDYDCN